MRRRLAIAALAAMLAACATPAQMHDEVQLNSVATGCGLALGEVIQDEAEKKLLLVIRQDPTAQQRACVVQWARRNGLKPVFVNMQRSAVDLNEGCRMIALIASAGFSIALTKVDSTYLPAINMSGVVQRVEGMTIKGPPELIPALTKRMQTEGWKAQVADERCVQVDPAGHSLDEVTALSFRVNNGEFGDLKLNFILRPLEKTRR